MLSRKAMHDLSELDASYRSVVSHITERSVCGSPVISPAALLITTRVAGTIVARQVKRPDFITSKAGAVRIEHSNRYTTSGACAAPTRCTTRRRVRARPGNLRQQYASRSKVILATRFLRSQTISCGDAPHSAAEFVRAVPKCSASMPREVTIPCEETR